MWVVCLLLAVGVALVFGQTLGFGFVNYDDDDYIHLRPNVVQGLTLPGLKWAFTHVHSENWHPLTSLSHQLDCQLYGLAAGGHHLSNLLLHTTAVVLLFLVLRAMTAKLWRSAFVAALFAFHPLRVESVAWISERKDVLSGVCFMLVLAAYVHYVRQPTRRRYLLVMLALALGLMAKPTLVTLPCLLLLLDFWPLPRALPLRRLLFEKIPLLLLSAAASAATLFAQSVTMSPLSNLQFAWRLENAFVSIGVYLRQFFWPVNLAVFYPHPRGSLPGWQVAIAITLVMSLSIGALILGRTRRYVPVGWFWFLGMLVPMIGLVQVGLQAHADRYTYLPQIGLGVLATWGIADITPRWRHRSKFLALGAGLVLIFFMTLAWKQTSIWRSSETLWRNALAVTTNNSVALTNLGNLMPAATAIPHYESALLLDPESPLPLNNLAWILATVPDPALRNGPRAIELAEKAVRISAATDPIYLRTLAATLAECGQFPEASKAAERALPLAVALGNTALAFDLRQNIASYRRGVPMRDASLLEASP